MKNLHQELLREICVCFKQNENLPLNTFGRHLSKIELGGHFYWIKLQREKGSLLHLQTYRHELNVYRTLSQLNPIHTLPFCIFKCKNKLEQKFYDEVLCVLDAPLYFDVSPQEFSWSTLVTFLINSLEPLLALHEIGWIHADLKYEHLRNYSNKAYLIDFEQAFDDRDSLQQKNHGTPRYMAPELFHAEEKSRATDIYALGIIWLEWLMQKKVSKKTYLDWAKWHCQDLTIELPKQYQALQSCLEQMLCKNKAKRLVNIHQIKQLLSEIV